jgi:hypothetical protein
MPTTKAWACSLGISTASIPPAVDGYEEPCSFTARQVAIRALILQGVVAVTAEVDPEPVIEWYQNQGIWMHATPQERAFFDAPRDIDQNQLRRFSWQAEAEWGLLWAVGKIETLGLPICQCDSRRLVDEIIPELGSEIEPFLSSAVLRPPGLLLAEDDRHYNLWCHLNLDIRKGGSQPDDLIYGVLWQRVCAFEWLHGITPWDEIKGDA